MQKYEDLMARRFSILNSGLNGKLHKKMNCFLING